MSQSVPWTTDQVAEEDLDQLLGGAIAELEDYDEPISSDEDEDEDEQRPASKKSAAAKAAKKMPAGGKKSGGANAATVSKLRSSSQKQKSSSATISNSSSATTVRDAAVDSVAPRGPLKAAFKQWKAKQGAPGCPLAGSLGIRMCLKVKLNKYFNLLHLIQGHICMSYVMCALFDPYLLICAMQWTRVS